MREPNSFTKDLIRLKSNRQFLTIMILLFVVVLFWVFVSVATSQRSERISPELTRLATPLIPSVELEVVSRIQQKRSYTNQELSSFTIYKILTDPDGRTERVVPLEVTAEDLVPIQSTPTPNETEEEEDEVTDSNLLGDLVEEDPGEPDSPGIQSN
jgi:hypothetical protein